MESDRIQGIALVRCAAGKAVESPHADLANLFGLYDKAVTAAAKPIREKYSGRVSALLQSSTGKDMSAVIALGGEAKKVIEGTSTVPSPMQSNTNANDSSQKGSLGNKGAMLKSFVSGKLWRIADGRSNDVFFLRAGGSGKRKRRAGDFAVSSTAAQAPPNSGLPDPAVCLILAAMPIRYYLRPNPLPGREKQFMAQVVSMDTVDEEALAARIAAELGDGGRESVDKVMAVLSRVVPQLIGDGYRVNVAGLAQFFPVMSGRFNGSEDEFEKKRHEVGVAAAVSQKLVEEVKEKAVLEKQKPSEQVPTPTYYKETGSHTVAGKVIPGNIGTLHGRRLAFDQQAADEGIFFVSSAEDKRVVRAKAYAVVQPAEIVFQVPESLAPGKWILEVRARVRGGKQVRTGRLSAPLETTRRGP